MLENMTTAVSVKNRGRPRKTPTKLKWVYNFDRKAKLEAHHCIKQHYSATKANNYFTGYDNA